MYTIIFIGIVKFVLKTELYTLRCRWENLFWFVIWVNKPFKVLLDLYIHPHATLCHCIISVSYPVYFYRRIKRQWPWMLVETFQLFVVIASGSAGRLKRQLLPIETKTRGTTATVTAKEQRERQKEQHTSTHKHPCHAQPCSTSGPAHRLWEASINNSGSHPPTLAGQPR